MLKRKEIENYLFDLEILKKLKPDINVETYKKLVSDIENGEIKDIVSTELKRMCGHEQTNKEKFKILLAENVTEDTKIYSQLKEVIFS